MMPSLHSLPSRTCSPLLESEVGVLVLSLDQEILYINARAYHFLEDLKARQSETSRPRNRGLPDLLVELCHQVTMQLRRSSSHIHWPGIQLQHRLEGKTGPVQTRVLALADVADPQQNKLMVMLESPAPHVTSAPPPVPRTALTSREQSVVDGMASGLTNKQIGAQLNLREGTVKEYVKRIRLKVGPKSRGSVRARIQNALIDGPIDQAGASSPITNRHNSFLA